MKNRKLLIIGFVLVALAQLYVPASMILEKEEVLETGKMYKFKTAPIDPTDPFRGKYIVLNFTNNSVMVDEDENWMYEEDLYVFLKEDAKGYAIIDSVSKNKPEHTADYFKAKYIRIYEKELFVKYPFNRYYMEESKAYEAELAYRKSVVSQQQKTYAKVMVKDGVAVLVDVLINEVSIREVVKANRLEKEGT